MTLEDILTCYTGSDKVPPLGFVPAPTLAFNSAAYYPTSSTCSLTLYLPTKYEDYCAFKISKADCCMHLKIMVVLV